MLSLKQKLNSVKRQYNGKRFIEGYGINPLSDTFLSGTRYKNVLSYFDQKLH